MDPPKTEPISKDYEAVMKAFEEKSEDWGYKHWRLFHLMSTQQLLLKLHALLIVGTCEKP